MCICAPICVYVHTETRRKKERNREGERAREIGELSDKACCLFLKSQYNALASFRCFNLLRTRRGDTTSKDYGCMSLQPWVQDGSFLADSR